MKSKLYAIIGKVGSIETARLIKISYPTLKKRLDKNNMGAFKKSEEEKIDELYDKLFPDE